MAYFRLSIIMTPVSFVSCTLLISTPFIMTGKMLEGLAKLNKWINLIQVASWFTGVNFRVIVSNKQTNEQTLGQKHTSITYQFTIAPTSDNFGPMIASVSIDLVFSGG